MTEPAIAAGGDMVISVFFDQANRPRYGAYDLSAPQRSWVEGIIDPATPFTDFWDLSIAYDAWNDRFVAAGFASKPVKGVPYRHIVTSRSADIMVSSSWEPWVSQFGLPVLAVPLDKPWIVAGEMTSAVQEFYIVYWRPDVRHYGYLRSIDGGDCWAEDEIRLAGTGEPVTGAFCAQPAVYGDGPVYVAYITRGTSEIRFLAGTDIDPVDPQNYVCTDPGDVGVSFAALYDSSAIPPPELTVALNLKFFDSALPGIAPNNFEAKTVPQLAVDPTDADRLYIVYHDVDAPGSNDVNVYLHELTRVNGDYWLLGPQEQVNDPSATINESDQFMPAVTVDDLGRIHVIYYDDRNYTDDPNNPGDQQPDSTLEPKFDVWYAAGEYNAQGQLVFAWHELYADPAEPAIDFQYDGAWLREYIGIAWDGPGPGRRSMERRSLSRVTRA